VRVLPENTSRFCAQNERRHHHVDDTGAVLGIVNALRFASTRPVAGPAGIDDAPHGTGFGYYAMVVSAMITRTFELRLTRESSGRMLMSSRQCRRALLRFAATAPERAFGRRPQGVVLERTHHSIAV
jgi:hypothetical protein